LDDLLPVALNRSGEPGLSNLVEVALSPLELFQRQGHRHPVPLDLAVQVGLTRAHRTFLHSLPLLPFDAGYPGQLGRTLRALGDFSNWPLDSRLTPGLHVLGWKASPNQAPSYALFGFRHRLQPEPR